MKAIRKLSLIMTFETENAETSENDKSLNINTYEMRLLKEE